MPVTDLNHREAAAAETATPGPRRTLHRDPVIAAIAVLKFAKAFVLVLLGLGALQLIRPEVRAEAQELFNAAGQAIDVVPVLRLLRGIGALGTASLRLLGVGAFFYAALFIVEGTGLWLERRWAEYLTIVATASFIPFEVYELARRLTVPRMSALVINLVVVGYLAYRINHPAPWQRWLDDWYARRDRAAPTL